MLQIMALLLLGLCTVAGAQADQASICAKARIEISQEVAFERQAFEARLTITNDLPEATVSNINVALQFHDEDGNLVEFTTQANDNTGKLFFVRPPTEFPSVPTGTSQTFTWLIIPSPGAGGTSPDGRLFFAGATLTYQALGRTEVVEVQPDFVFVKPQPLLALDYFLPAEVFGDDPETSTVEPIEPFTLGLRIRNTGAGLARSVSIASGQPHIVRHDADLLVSFSIKSATVNDVPVAPLLQAPAGDLSPGAAAVVDWQMEASLYGRITGFDATYTHADDLGGKVTSLVDDQAIKKHSLLGQVLVDLAGRDKIHDFLAFSQDGPLEVFESNGTTTEIPASAIFLDLQVTGVGPRRQVSTSSSPPSDSQFVYLKAPLPGDVIPSVRRVVRADGKVLPSSNGWVSKTRVSPGTYARFVNIFDTYAGAALSYEVEFGASDASNLPPVLGPLRDLTVHPGVPVTFAVTASDPDGTLPLLSASQLPAGASFVPGTGSGTFSWTPSTAQKGEYVLTFHASDGVAEDVKSILLVVTDDSLSKNWRDRWFGQSAPPEISANWADPDADGLSNLLEYALDLDPTSSSIENKPAIGKVKIDGKNYLTLSFVHRTDDPQLHLEVIGSNDLRQAEQSWTVQTEEITQSQDGLAPFMQRTTIRDSVALEDAGFRFLRLKVSLDQ